MGREAVHANVQMGKLPRPDQAKLATCEGRDWPSQRLWQRFRPKSACQNTVRLRAEPGKSSRDPDSALERAVLILQQQQQLAAELSRLQAQELSTAEQEQLQALLTSAATAEPPAVQMEQSMPSNMSKSARSKRTQKRNPIGKKAPSISSGTAQAGKSDKKEYRHFPDKGPLSEEERVKLPRDVQKLLRSAGVLDAVSWDGRPASPTTGSFPETTKASQVEELMLQAGRLKQRTGTRDMPQQEDGYGTGIPEGFADEYDEYCLGDDEEFIAGEGVDEMVQMLESGEPLPPDPEYEGLQSETSEKFKARMDKWRHAYEAQYLDRKDWKITPEEFNEIAKDYEESSQAWDTRDILTVQPAPDWPPEVQKHYDRFQWLLFLMRKAHMQASPAAPPRTLVTAGLAAEGLIFEDPVLESIGPGTWQEYMERVSKAGGHAEIGNVWGEMGSERPFPTWRVFVDTWLSLPYPLWYQQYFELHAHHDNPPNLGSLIPDGSPPPDPFAPEPDLWEPQPLRYPKGRREKPSKARGFGLKADPEPVEEPSPLEQLVGFTMDLSVPPSHQGQSLPGEGIYKYLEPLRKCQADLARQSGGLSEASSAVLDALPSTSQAETPFFHTSKPWRRFQYATCEEDPWHGPPTRRRRKRAGRHRLVVWDRRGSPEDARAAEAEALANWRPDFGTAPSPSSRMLGNPITRSPDVRAGRRLVQQTTCTLKESPGRSPASFEVLSYSGGRWQQPPCTASSLLHLSEEDTPALPESDEPGQAWRSGQWLCIPATTCYSLDNDLGQVDKVQVAWGAILGHALGNDQDLVDLYLRQLQLYQQHDPTCQRVKVLRLHMPTLDDEQLELLEQESMPD